MNDVTYAGGQVVSNGREIGSRLLYYVEHSGRRIVAALVILLIGWLAARAVKWAVSVTRPIGSCC